MDKLKEIIIESITRIMSQNDMSQVTLAEKAKMDPVQLNRILKGKKGAGRKSLEAIARGLGVSVEELIRPTPPKEKTPITVASVLQALTQMEGDFDELLSVLSSYEKLKRDDPDKARIVRVNLGLESIGSSHSESAKPRKQK